MKLHQVNQEELSYEEYREMIIAAITEIVANVIEGKRYARDGQNLLKNLPMEAMYPPLSWVEMLPSGLETWIQKLQQKNSDNQISNYYFRFEAKSVGGSGMNRGSLFVTYGWVKVK